ncbi:DUF1311 domain-containing protein [Chitinimonas arctica]|uniref:DUF1311 domain-containing protein n=1 Tax=Chitinimonas arctica TaxID=2594795 RepID=A0A516SB27_9NEIS|nr:lysozyme inhibitor LprI family protein [Chitinimonas arctica]QDQ25352.1 DUF1311 domain-containing protein [Chitinimonas arctica]
MTKKWLESIALTGITVLAINASAASFDCTTAKRTAEKLICTDSNLSKLDEQLHEAYRKLGSNKQLRTQQRAWLKTRDACLEVTCLTGVYGQRLAVLQSLAPISAKNGLPVTTKAERSSHATTHAGQSDFCNEFSNDLEKTPLGSTERFVEYADGEGRAKIFKDVDIDGDKKNDEVMQDCGSISEGTCTLYIQLSGGRGYEFTDKPFTLIRLRGEYYALVGHTYPEINTGNRRLFALSSRKASLACKGL